MKELKKLLFFIIMYNVIFILILNLQYRFRFNETDDLMANLLYSSIISMYFSIITLACYCLSWIINKVIIKKLKINSALKSAFFLLITVILTYMYMSIVNQNSILILITVISSSLALLLSLFKYQKLDLFKD